jgi:2-polyprenyl-3-methyl-5-hydroxy-6-metoxy-1,4-benzoquinol methylase
MMTNINTSEYWDTVYRREWEAGQVTGPEYSRDYGPIHDAVIALIPDGSSVLDITCGPGLLCSKVKRRCPATEVVGVDFSEVTIKLCQARDQSLGVRYACLDIRHALPSLDRQFDVVCMCEILEHLDDPEKVVADAMSLLKTGGRYILSCPHDDHIPDAEHVRRWGHDELFHLLAPYSDTISFMHFPPPWFHVWMLAYLTKNNGVAGA